MVARAAGCLKAGKGVIVDATFKNREHRERFAALGERTATPLLFIECRADESQTFARLRARSGRSGEVSDATPGIYLRQREEFAPMDDLPPSIHMVVDTDADPDLLVAGVLERLRENAKPRAGMP